MISIDDVLEEGKRTRDIIVIHIVSEKNKMSNDNGDSDDEDYIPIFSPKLVLDQDYCLFKPPKKIKYDISYFYLNMYKENDTAKLDPSILFNETIVDKSGEEWNTSFLQFLSDHEDALKFSYNHVLIYLAVKEYNFYTIPTGVRYVISILKKFPVKITLMQTPTAPPLKYRGLYKFSTFNKKNFFPLKDKQDFDNARRLTCQNWFRKFLNNLDHCGKGRLLQFTGTCYLNAIVNGFTLSRWLKRLVIFQMNRYIHENPESKTYIKLPLTNLSVCPSGSSLQYDSILKYFYRLVYNISCLGNKPLQTFENLMVHASKELFSPNLSGENGYPTFGLFAYLLATNTNFALLLHVGQEKNKFGIVVRNIYQLYKPKSKEIKILKSWPVFDIHDFKMVDIHTATEFDIIIFIENPRGRLGDDNKKKYNSKEIISLIGEHFVPEIANIGIDLEIEEEDLPHAICGFFCDGIPKIYDSAHNIILEVDWTNDKRLTDELQKALETYWGSIYGSQMYYIMYTNKSLQVYLKDQKCVLIE